MRRGSAATVAALAAVLLTASPAGAATTQPTTTSADLIVWTECGTTFKGQCATIPVPVNWQNPRGVPIRLAIGRLPATDPANRIGVLVAFPGGPGISGINTYTTGRRIPDDSPLRKYFDIVTMDPRGVARSNPVVCSAELVAATPTTYPANEAEYHALLAFNDRLARDCRDNTGPLFDHVDSISAAYDVEALRVALGENRISFFAASYGTQVGQHYAELFPNRIRAMALDSNLDHSVTSAFDFMRETSREQEASFLEFTSWCAGTAACALHGRDALAVWDTLHAKATAGSLIDPETGQPVTAEALRTQMNNMMFRPKEHWIPLAARLSALAASSSRPTPATPVTGAATVENPQWAIWCSDWRWNITSFAQLDDYRKRIEATVAPHTKLAQFWSDITSCLGWSGAFNNPQRPLRINGTPTILLTKDRHDVSTPPAWTTSVAAQIRNAVVLDYDGVGHGAWRVSLCARQHIERYLISGTTPRAGVRCLPEYPTGPSMTSIVDGGDVPASSRSTH